MHCPRNCNPSLLALAVLALVAAASACASEGITAARLPGNPMVRPDMMQPACDGAYDSNFPTIIRAPHWVRPRLGNFYMYFSDHHGMFINMAYADRIGGPWRVHAPGTLTLEQVYVANNETFNLKNLSSSTEVASPEVYVDEANRRIGMYVHARLPYNGYTSLTGIAFSPTACTLTCVRAFSPCPMCAALRGAATATTSICSIAAATCSGRPTATPMSRRATASSATPLPMRRWSMATATRASSVTWA